MGRSADDLQMISMEVAANFRGVLAKVTAISSSARLVAVSKTKPAELLKSVYDAGCRVFGENYVQELVQKSQELPQDIQWRFIGTLQSNKVRDVLSVPNLTTIETVDRPKLAKTIEKHCEAMNRTVDVFVQVNTSGEDSKGGVTPQSEQLYDLINVLVNDCPHVTLAGLMTIGNPNPDPPNKDFQMLVSCREDVIQRFPTLSGKSLELSMGMSADFELALQNGSTNVRVGSTIFGARNYPSKV